MKKLIIYDDLENIIIGDMKKLIICDDLEKFILGDMIKTAPEFIIQGMIEYLRSAVRRCGYAGVPDCFVLDTTIREEGRGE